MARVARLAGALLAQSDKSYYLVGNTKRPCDFTAHGFLPPPKIDAVVTPYVALSTLREIDVEPPWLMLDLEGEALATLLSERFLIVRNGSVSDRLWNLVAGLRDEDEAEQYGNLEPPSAIDARWLVAMPKAVWDVVRDSVLRCT